tara:strand:- start:6159 stop:6746 length:588 start_codon:yes stop_codon:yes gene_type:complete
MKNTTIPTILLKKVIHRDKIQLLLLFPFNYEIKNSLIAIGGYLWSQTLRGWYTEFNSENIVLLKQALNDKATFTLDSSVYKKLRIKPIRKMQEISEENELIMRLYVKHLKGEKYSESTIKTYVAFIADFFYYIKDTPIVSISNRTVELYIEAVFVPRNYSVNTNRKFMNAIKLFKVFYPECAINELELKTHLTWR